MHLLSRPLTQFPAKENLFIPNYVHCPKAQAWFPSDAQKTPASQCCLLFLSLSLILLQQSLGQVLGAAESSSLATSSPAANRTSTHSVLPRSLTSASSCPPSSYPVLLSSTMFRSLQNYPPDLFPRHQTSVCFLLKLFENLPTSFHPSPTACRHCLLLLINSAPYLPIISSCQFPWTTQHTPTESQQSMQFHAVVMGCRNKMTAESTNI